MSAPPTAPPSQAGAKEDDFYVDLYQGDEILDVAEAEEDASEVESKASETKCRVSPSAFCLGPGYAVVCCMEHICC